MTHTALEDRDPATPPCDSLAEAIVLEGILSHPERLVHDVRPLLVFPEHRVCLDAMHRAYNAAPDAPWGRFYIRWLGELERAMPGHGAELETLLLDVGNEASRWRWTRYDEDRVAHVNASDYSHDWQWWLDRLKLIAEARRLIASAQEMAERAWRCDVDGAYAAIPARAPADIGMEIP